MKNNLLEVGDVLFDYKRWGGLKKLIVDKVTPKQATTGMYRMNREVGTDFNKRLVAKRIGEYGNFYISTPELEAEYELGELRRSAEVSLNSVNASLLNKEQCEAVINLLSPLKDLSKK